MFVCLSQYRRWFYCIFIINNLHFIYGQVTCDDIPISKTARADRNLQPPFDVGVTVTLKCKPGYILHSGVKTTAVCKEQNGTGVWDVTDKCRGVTCDSPGDIENGERIGELFQFPHGVKYECHEGYKLKGHHTIYCETTQEWSGKPPTCNAIFCKEPTNPSNGNVNYQSLAYHSFITYQCNSGYRLIGPDKRQCQENETWSGSEPTCVVIECPNPGPLHGGYIHRLSGQEGDKYKYQDIIVYYCNVSGRKHSAKCTEHGDWSSPPPECEDETTVVTTEDTKVTTENNSNQCKNIPDIMHGSHTSQSANSVTYKCDTGYKLTGSPKITCLPSGKWDSSPPTCTKPSSNIGLIIGIVIAVIVILSISIAGVIIYFRKRKKLSSPAKANKAFTSDAVNMDEVQRLEKNDRPIPVTVL